MLPLVLLMIQGILLGKQEIFLEVERWKLVEWDIEAWTKAIFKLS